MENWVEMTMVVLVRSALYICQDNLKTNFSLLVSFFSSQIRTTWTLRDMLLESAYFFHGVRVMNLKVKL